MKSLNIRDSSEQHSVTEFEAFKGFICHPQGTYSGYNPQRSAKFKISALV